MPFNVELAAQYLGTLLQGVSAPVTGEMPTVVWLLTTHGQMRNWSSWYAAQGYCFVRVFRALRTWHALVLQSVGAYWEMSEYRALLRSQAYCVVDSFIKWLGTRTDGRQAQAIFKHCHIVVNGPTLDAPHRVCMMVPDWSSQMTPLETSVSCGEVQELTRSSAVSCASNPMQFGVFARSQAFRLAARQAKQSRGPNGPTHERTQAATRAARQYNVGA